LLSRMLMPMIWKSRSSGWDLLPWIPQNADNNLRVQREDCQRRTVFDAPARDYRYRVQRTLHSSVVSSSHSWTLNFQR
jgi:hypothetical protein